MSLGERAVAVELGELGPGGLEVWRGGVNTWECDEMGHLNVRFYVAHHPDFPHETTADQWFDENQFECYRNLGFTIGEMRGASSCSMAAVMMASPPASTGAR